MIAAPCARWGLAGVLAGAMAAAAAAPSVALPPSAPDGAEPHCPGPGADARPASGARELVWVADTPDGRPPLARPFALIVRVCVPGAVLRHVDATMPEHGHGMNYRASVRPLADGRWRVEGLMLHMPGRWRWRFDLGIDGSLRRVAEDLMLP